LGLPAPVDLGDLLEPFASRGVDLGLDRLAGALAAGGHPERRFAAVQVAGTNGKGSICTFLAAILAEAGLAVEPVLKVHEGRPNIEDAIRSGQIQLVINTPIGRQAAHDDRYLRRAALDYAVPTVTTLAGARAAVEAIAALRRQPELEVVALQDIHRPWRS
jgi:hypothetical protein